MTLQKMAKSLGSAYVKTSLWGKLLLFICLLLLVMLVFKGFKTNKFIEGFQQQDQFLIKTDAGIYDEFYANVYDYLVFNNLKDDYEIGYIMNNAAPTSKSKILDIFKDYGKEKGFGAIIADSLMIISSILIASYLKGKTLNSNIIILIFSIYLVPYMIYTV